MILSRSSWPRAIVAMLLLSPMLAHAALFGVFHDRTLEREVLGRIDTTAGVVVNPAGFAVAGCCRISGSLVTVDNASGTAYLVNPGADAAAAWQLHRFSIANGAVTSVTLPVGEHVLAVARRSSPSTLFAISEAGAVFRLVTILDNGSVTPVGGPLAICCAIRAGVAALSADATRFAFIRNDPADASGMHHLILVNTASGALVSDTVLARVPDLLHSITGSVFLASYHDAGTQRVGQINADGSITAIGAGAAGCCAVLAGVGARAADSVHLVGGLLTAPTASSLYRVALATGAFTSLGAWPSRYVPHGLFESNAAFVGDLIFANGFDLAAVASPDVLPANAAMNATFDASNASADVSSDPAGDAVNTLDIKAAQPVPLAPDGVAAVPLPLGASWQWSALIVLLAAAAVHARRRVI